MNDNKTLYSAKTIACFFIICIHISFPGTLGRLSLILSRFTVPLFFMITGYYTFYKNPEKTKCILNNRLKKIIKLALICTLLYLILNVFKQLITSNISNYISSLISYKNIMKLLIFNWTTPFIGVGHLWYLFALIYDYLLFKFINKHNLYKLSYIYSIIAIIVVYMVEVCNYYYKLGFSEIYWRNWLFVGFPFMMLGHLFHKKEDVFVNKSKVFLATVFLLVSLIISFYFIETILIKDILFLYINSLIIDFLIFYISIHNSNINIFYKLGKYDSGNIYIIHYAVILFLNFIIMFSNNKIYLSGYILPFLVFLISYILSLLYRKIMNAFKKKSAN